MYIQISSILYQYFIIIYLFYYIYSDTSQERSDLNLSWELDAVAVCFYLYFKNIDIVYEINVC